MKSLFQTGWSRLIAAAILAAACTACSWNPPPSTNTQSDTGASVQDRESQQYYDRERAERNALSSGFIKIGP